MTSPNGASSETRRSPPVPHFLRLSWTRPSIGLRNSSHGSPLGTGHHRHAWELLVRVLRPVAAPHGHDQPHDLAAPLKPGPAHRGRHPVGDEWIGGDHHMGPRNQHREQALGPLLEESLQTLQVGVGQRGETGQRRAPMAVEGGRKPPDPSPSASELGLLAPAVLDQSVGGIGHDPVDGLLLGVGQPLPAVPLKQRRLAHLDRRQPRPNPHTHNLHQCNSTVGHWPSARSNRPRPNVHVVTRPRAGDTHHPLQPAPPERSRGHSTTGGRRPLARFDGAPAEGQPAPAGG